jgi:polysaccharide export outer membrane protein
MSNVHSSMAGLRRLAGAGCVALAAGLAGCAASPGMHMDAGLEALRARAELVPLSLDTVRSLRQQAQARAGQPFTPPPPFLHGAAPFEYRIAPQDVLQVTVWNRPELNNPNNTSNEINGRVVGADGTIYFPYIGTLGAAGRTVQELRELITNGLQKVIKQPQVDVAVLQYRGQRVIISGQVRSPGTVPITDVPPNITEMLARAGGATADADLASVTVTRGLQTVKLDLQSLFYEGDTRVDLRLRHGDIVNVPERRAAKVFVTGEVITPKAVPMPRGPLTLAEALAEAGGVNPLSANAGQVFVLRGEAGGDARPTVFHLNASAPDALLLADQFALASRDVVYVDTAPVVRWARLINNILPSATFARESLNDLSRGLPR